MFNVQLRVINNHLKINMQETQTDRKHMEQILVPVNLSKTLHNRIHVSVRIKPLQRGED